VGITLVNDDDEDDDDQGKSVVRLDWSGPAWSHHHDRQIWITKWIPRQVGTWDPATNTFTPRFTTPNRAGGLAWDSAKKVLWVGLLGGTVVPYRLNGTPYNAGFQPFGPIGDTIDGLEFVRKGGSSPPRLTWAACARNDLWPVAAPPREPATEIRQEPG
jgi:hypothetical protein